MTTIASPYSKTRTPAWRMARYQRAFSKTFKVLAVFANPHSTPAERAAAIVEARHATEEAQAVLTKEARQ